MSQLVNLSDDVYARLTKLKKIKSTSYSEIVNELLEKKEEEKYETKKDLLEYIEKLEIKYKGKKRENISENIDEILYG
ncbi:MAG: antitoxin VapB family protein [Candidatus Micrarchaeia archaeon]|jgi:predicted CopG family antitoxin